MAIAGYNPEEAIVSGLEWQQILTEKLHLSFSTHPSDASRIASLKAMIPQATAAKFGMIYNNNNIEVYNRKANSNELVFCLLED
jgi:hypothetical protein